LFDRNGELSRRKLLIELIKSHKSAMLE